ncbi:MAG: cytochrome c oxidase subunit 3, partial [Proteobacteria bacterium]|nr:cytochrome c oxidase subunit 3 [Pseudomonadota bacterium]
MSDHLTQNQSSLQNHPYHLVDPSPWPLASSMAVLVLAVGAILFMHNIDHWVFILGFILIAGCFIGWWRDVLKEANTKGVHTKAVQNGLKIGMVLFIASEVMLFAAFFGSYFYVSMNLPGFENFQWPPKGIIPLDPLHLPYLNTLILLLSGTTLTWAHHELLIGQFSKVTKALLLTVILGLIFSFVQIFEYVHASFAFKDDYCIFITKKAAPHFAKKINATSWRHECVEVWEST